MLDGLKILVTRPRQQAKNLCNMVVDAGGDAIAFPTIDIVDAKQEYNFSEQQDIIIFVSSNAVRYFHPTRALSSITWVAIGASTAKSMHDANLAVDIEAPSPGGSDCLLSTSILQDVKGKRILIIRGEGGRELLADTLEARGGKVTYFEVYRRIITSPSPQQVQQALTAECILITSVMSLANLCLLVGKENIKKKHLIVVSNRIKQYAIGEGFQYIDVAEDASDKSAMQQILKME